MTHIIRETQHDFWSTVPSGCHVLCHEALVGGISISIIGAIWAIATSEAKVANFEFTVSVDEQISRFEVAMKDASRMDELETAEGLVDEGLEVCVGERLSRANL